MAFIACLMTAFFALRSKAIVRIFLATMLCSGIFNLRRVVLLWYCSRWIGALSSPFKVLLLLCKLVRFRNFLRTWLPRNHAGADTSTETGRFKTQILVNQKKEFLVEGTWNLAFVGATFSPSLVFFFSFIFLFFSRPLLVATDHHPWSFSFLFFSFLRPPFVAASLASRTSTALVCSSSVKKSFAFLTWATRRTKKTQRRIL